MAMKAGSLRWPITIQRKTPVQSGTTGEVTYTWSDFATTRADLVPVSRVSSRSAWEAVTASQIKPRKIIQFTIRYLAGLDESMRVMFNGAPYDIKSIINVDTRNREMFLITEFGLDQG